MPDRAKLKMELKTRAPTRPKRPKGEADGAAGALWGAYFELCKQVRTEKRRPVRLTRCQIRDVAY